MASEKISMANASSTTTPASQLEPVVSMLDWNKYISSVQNIDSFGSDAVRIHQDVNRLCPFLFGRQTKLEVTEIAKDLTIDNFTVNGSREVELMLNRPQPSLRSISFVREQSIANYSVDSNSLISILSNHGIEPSFVDLMLGFRNPRPHAEQGYGIWQASETPTDSQMVVSYQLRYMERNDYNNGLTWSSRQIGVYHKITEPSQCSVILMLHANKQCKIKEWMEYQSSPTRRTAMLHLLHRPFALHTLIFSTYLHNWRWYLEDLGQSVEDTENSWMTIDLSAVANERSFAHLQHLRNIDAKLLTAMSVLEATVDTICHILRLIESVRNQQSQALPPNPPGSGCTSRDTAQDKQGLFDLLQRCKAYQRSAAEIQRRNEKLIQTATDGINLSAQSVASRVSHSVRIVTIITLVYLPAQFVATFFGTNFVLFDADSGLIRFARDYWVFLAAAIPSTIITIAIWLAVTRKRNVVGSRGIAA